MRQNAPVCRFSGQMDKYMPMVGKTRLRASYAVIFSAGMKKQGQSLRTAPAFYGNMAFTDGLCYYSPSTALQNAVSASPDSPASSA